MTMLSTLALAASMAAPSVLLEATPDKAVYLTGEAVTIKLSIKNSGKEPVIVADAKHPVYPAGSLRTTLRDDAGRELMASSNLHEGQWMVPHLIAKRHFIEVKPASAAQVGYEKITNIWPERRPALKSDYEFLQRQPLAPGKYKVYYSYSFQRRLAAEPNSKWTVTNEKGEKLQGYIYRRKFAEGAKELYDKAFTGTLRAITEFEVRPATR